MILKFDKPMSIEEARRIYTDDVKFITSTKGYPDVTGVEFSEELQKRIHKKKRLSPKVTKMANRIIEKYQKKIDKIWKKRFSEIKQAIRTTKKAATPTQREQVKKILELLRNDLVEEATDRFEEGFKLGKLRGQIISNQELDFNSISDEEQKLIDKRMEENIAYVEAFADDIGASVQKVLEEPFDTLLDLEDAITEKVEEPKKSRMNLYPLAILGLITAGAIYAITKLRDQFPDAAPPGGYWTPHPDEGLGGEICDGCDANIGKFFTWEEFEKAYQNQDCLTRCRCDLDTER